MNATVNRVIYALLPIVMAGADAMYQAVQAQQAGGKPIDWQQVGFVTAMAALGALVAANRPRVGSEELAAQVNDLKSQGVRKRDMAVVKKTTEANQV